MFIEVRQDSTVTNNSLDFRAGVNSDETATDISIVCLSMSHSSGEINCSYRFEMTPNKFRNIRD